MTNAWSESTEKAVLYPDDLPEHGPLSIVSEEPLSAEDVPHEEARFGSWAELHEDHAAEYIATPEAVRTLIGAAVEEQGFPCTIEVLEAERGPRDHDPWKIEGRIVEDGDPL